LKTDIFEYEYKNNINDFRNFTHFLIGGMALGKALFSNPELPILMWILGGFYILFAILFWKITFTHPKE